MRASWDETWMSVAESVALRSPCVRKYGAVLVSSTNRILATGYNGAPRGLATNPLEVVTDTCADWCDHATSDDPSPCYDDCFSIHAEANALLFCDRAVREGGTLYVTSNPCWTCAKQVANSGVARVVAPFDVQYRDPGRVLAFLERCNLEVTVWGR